MRRRALLPALAVAAPLALLPASVQPAASGTLDRLKAGGALRIGYRADARPLSFRDEGGRPSGYSVALSQAIVQDIKRVSGLGGITIDWVPATIEDRFDALREGRIDLLCGASSISLSRRERVSFSIPTFAGGIGAIVRSDASDPLRTVLAGQAQTFQPVWHASAVQVLEGRAFAAVQGTTADTWLADRIRAHEARAEFIRVGGYEAGVQAVADGKADALFGERAVLFDAARRHPLASQLLVVDRFFTYEPLALGLPRGDENLRLLVDRTLSGLYRSGGIDGIYTPWFGAPTTSVQSFLFLAAIPQ